MGYLKKYVGYDSLSALAKMSVLQLTQKFAKEMHFQIAFVLY